MSTSEYIAGSTAVAPTRRASDIKGLKILKAPAEHDTGKYWTHNTEDCSFKKNAYTGKGKKEANAMEEVLAQVKIQARMIEQLEKKLKNLDDDDMSTN